MHVACDNCGLRYLVEITNLRPLEILIGILILVQIVKPK